jgi:hypothetical protein
MSDACSRRATGGGVPAERLVDLKPEADPLTPGAGVELVEGLAAATELG